MTIIVPELEYDQPFSVQTWPGADWSQAISGSHIWTILLFMCGTSYYPPLCEMVIVSRHGLVPGGIQVISWANDAWRLGFRESACTQANPPTRSSRNVKYARSQPVNLCTLIYSYWLKLIKSSLLNLSEQINNYWVQVIPVLSVCTTYVIHM